MEAFHTSIFMTSEKRIFFCFTVAFSRGNSPTCTFGILATSWCQIRKGEIRDGDIASLVKKWKLNNFLKGKVAARDDFALANTIRPPNPHLFRVERYIIEEADTIIFWKWIRIRNGQRATPRTPPQDLIVNFISSAFEMSCPESRCNHIWLFIKAPLWSHGPLPPCRSEKSKLTHCALGRVVGLQGWWRRCGSIQHYLV